MTAFPGGPLDPDGLREFVLKETRALADSMQGPSGKDILADIPELEEVRALARNALAAERFELNELKAVGAPQEDIRRQQMDVDAAASEYEALGGDPAAVPADHVSALVTSPEPGTVSFWTDVPVASASCVNGHWEARAEDLPPGYAPYEQTDEEHNAGPEL